jgi:hypothetical protein
MTCSAPDALFMIHETRKSARTETGPRAYNSVAIILAQFPRAFAVATFAIVSGDSPTCYDGLSLRLSLSS